MQLTVSVLWDQNFERVRARAHYRDFLQSKPRPWSKQFEDSLEMNRMPRFK